jgi:enoyl-CoA hydratase/carnithine racemase
LQHGDGVAVLQGFAPETPQEAERPRSKGVRLSQPRWSRSDDVCKRQDAGGGRGGDRFITFNQPEKRNVISVEMWTGLAAILDQFEADPAVKVVVLTGAGPKAFVSGADISQFDQLRGDADAQQEYDRMTSAGAPP